MDILGGRISDLLSLTSYRKNTPSLRDCVSQLIENAKEDVAKIGFSKNTEAWTHTEFWKAIQLLVRPFFFLFLSFCSFLSVLFFIEHSAIFVLSQNKGGRVKYSDLLFNAFGGNEEGLRGLIQVFFFLSLSFFLYHWCLF